MLAEDWLKKSQFEEIKTARANFLDKIKNVTKNKIFLPNCVY